MKRVFVIVGVSLITLAAQAQSGRNPSQAVREWTMQKDARVQQPHSLASCTTSTPITPPVVLTGNITFSSCTDILGLREDVYSVTATAGQTIDIDFSSNSFETFLYMYIGNGTSIKTNSVSTLPFSGPGTSQTTAHHTFAASGTYRLEAESLWSSDPVGSLPWAGPYVLSVTLSGGMPTPGTSPNTQIVPIVGHVTGAGGSAFRSDLKLYNGSSSTVTGRLVFTPRNQSRSSSDPSIAFNVQPFGVRFYEDVYALGYPGGNGAARLTIVPDSSTSAPLVVDTSTYTANPDGGELAQSPTVSTASSYFGAGTKLVGLLGKGSERSNIFVMTASDAVIVWRYRDSNGSASAPVTRSYSKDSTFQMSVSDITGTTPSPNATLEATVQSGSVRIALSPVNNVSNQGRWADFKQAP